MKCGKNSEKPLPVITSSYQPIIFFCPGSMAFEKLKVVLQLLVTGIHVH